MKINVQDKPYSEVMALPRAIHKAPLKPNLFFKLLLRAVSSPDLRSAKFTYETHGMEKLGRGPCLILMNHSSFIDLKIAHRVFFPRPLSVVCTSDGFVGKEWLMRQMGCIPTQKFVGDITLVRDLQYALGKLKSSVLMYPEASYSFDGTKTPLPASLGRLLKLLGVPVVTVITEGAFSRDPLYNSLQTRQVDVRADVTYLLSPEEIKSKSASELNTILDSVFSFDNFRWQAENKIEIAESFRADGLNRILYKCPYCMTEGKMNGKGITLTCSNCGKSYELGLNGQMKAADGITEYPHIPDWYAWERNEVRREIEEGRYSLKTPVDIKMMVDYNSIYSVGSGILTHNADGFHLTGCGGELDYSQKPGFSYSLYSDYYWYEIGDMICIGDRDRLFYCFPKKSGDIVAKTRLAAEEMFKLCRAKIRTPNQVNN